MTNQNLRADHVKSAISPINFYCHELRLTALNGNGWQEAGLCPFHDDKNPGSFHVNLNTGAFKCFSCGTKGGDIIAFVMALHQLRFYDALTKLSKDWGLI